tara:strand:+ start:80 stop:1273 length:1194 start_codon:yes stop_codon:yes gene_type:complete
LSLDKFTKYQLKYICFNINQRKGIAMAVRRISCSIFSSVILTLFVFGEVLAGGVFEVRDVKVDITAETAAKARETALSDGEFRAFRLLLKRLTLSEDHQRLPQLDSGEIATYVSDFSISNEKTSAVRYLAQLHFRFKPLEVRRLLYDEGLSFAETASKPVLILPVFQPASGLVLWEKPNPWWEAWTKRAFDHGLIRITLPRGDLSDINTLSTKQVLGAEVKALGKLAERYNAGDTLVVYARIGLNPDGSGARRLDVSMIRYSVLSEPETIKIALDESEGESLNDLLLRGTEVATSMIEDPWKRANLIKSADGKNIAITIPITSLSDWLELQERLENVSVIRLIEIVLVSLGEIRVNLRFVGNYTQLQTALGQSDLVLIKEDDEQVLYPSSPIKRRKL